MATTPIGNGSGAQIAEEMLQKLADDLARSLSKNAPAGKVLPPPQPPGVTPSGGGAVADASAAVRTAVGQTEKAALIMGMSPVPGVRPQQPAAISDTAAVLLAEVATSDLTKLTKILDPQPDPTVNRILEKLLTNATQELAKGNIERAVGYLADYATRDPHRAEALPMQPALADLRDKIESLVGRMTIVAKMSAEDGLSRAEQSSSQVSGKLPHWETHADVLIKLAHRFFEAGGYANYSRSTELTRLVSDGIKAEAKPVAQALAASAAANASASVASGTAANQMLPGVNVPYWASPEVALPRSIENRIPSSRRQLATPWDDVFQNVRDLKEISTTALRQLWRRAPLLFMLMAWFSLGLTGGIGFAIASRFWPDSVVVNIGNFVFDLWGIGFLALVGFGFYVRVRQRRY